MRLTCRGSISEPLLLMYDTDFGTTVLSVAQLFRSMTRRQEEILASNNPPPPPIETLSSAGQVSRQTELQPTTYGSRHAQSVQKKSCVTLATSFDPPAVTMNAHVVTGPGREPEQLEAAAVPSGPAAWSVEAWVTDAEPCAAALSGGSQLTSPGTGALSIQDSASGVAQMLPAWGYASAYSVAPPEGYGAALVAQAGAPADPSISSEQRKRHVRALPAVMSGVITTATGSASALQEQSSQATSMIQLPSGFESFEDLLHHGVNLWNVQLKLCVVLGLCCKRVTDLQVCSCALHVYRWSSSHQLCVTPVL